MSRELKLIGCALFAWGFGEGLYVFFEPVYMQGLGASPTLIGLIYSFYGMTSVVTHVASGYLADRFGRRPFIRAAFIVGVVTAAWMGLARSLAGFNAAMIVYGLSWCLSSPLFSYATEARGSWSISRALAFVSAVYNLGLAIGPPIGGWLGELLGLQKVFLIGASFIGVGALLIFFIPSQPVVRRAPGEKFSVSVLQPRFLLYLGLILFAAFAAYLSQPLSQNFLSTYRGLSLPEIGRITSLAGVGTVVLNLGMGLLEVRTAFFLAQAVVALFPLLMWQGSGVAWYALGYFLLGGYKTFRSMACAQARSAVQPADMGLAYGMTEAVISIAVILAPPVAGLFYMKNPVSVYIISFVLILAAIAAGAFLSPHTHSRVVDEKDALVRLP